MALQCAPESFFVSGCTHFVGWDKLASSAGPPRTRQSVLDGPALEASLSHPTLGYGASAPFHRSDATSLSSFSTVSTICGEAPVSR